MADPHAIPSTADPSTLPDPPDLMETNEPPHTADLEPTKLGITFKAALQNKEDSFNGQYLKCDNGKAPLMPLEIGGTVLLSAEDKERIHTP